MKSPYLLFQYNSLYQNVKRHSKHGEYFFKELMAVFQQRAELELNYAKGIQKLAGKLIRASKGMSNNSTYSAWCHVSDEMYSTADTHRTLGNAFQQEAVLELRQVLDEHNKRKRPLDNHVEKTGKLLMANWNEQLKMKKKLLGMTREHEALFNFVETNKHICTEKEKQKMLNRLTKSAETQTKLDEEYFKRNMEGHQIRLKWENTLKNCYQIIQELEKQRLEMLSTTLDRYHLHMSSFGQSLIHGQRGVEQAIQRVDLQKDIQALVEEISATAQENKTDFLMTDYFEEDSKSLMGKERRRDALKVKLQRLEHSIAKTKKDCEGLQTLMKSYADNPSFSNQKHLEETQQLLEETTLKQELLEATHYKVSLSLGPLEGNPRTAHRFHHSISRDPLGLTLTRDSLGLTLTRDPLGLTRDPLGLTLTRDPLGLTRDPLGLTLTRDPLSLTLTRDPLGLTLTRDPLSLTRDPLGLTLTRDPLSLTLTRDPLGLTLTRDPLSLTRDPLALTLTRDPLALTLVK
ncbi:unnamed protein product [Lota lota]